MLEVSNLKKNFGNVEAVNIDSFEVGEAQMVAVLGASGCGKTTLLRICAGLETQDTGSIVLNGEDITDLRPDKRQVNMVFQSYALFPHMNVADNIAYGLKVAKLPTSQITTEYKKAIKLVRLDGLDKRMPNQLSGGQQQRIALARALVMKPKVLLLDEPLSSLDENLRIEMRDHLCNLQAQVGISFIFVTHDQAEALAISQKLVIMQDAKIAQQGSPEQVYLRPDNIEVAKFIGRITLATKDQQNSSIHSELSTKLGDVAKDISTFGIRPEIINISSMPKSDYLSLEVSVTRIEFIGDSKIIFLQDDKGATLTARILSNQTLATNQKIFANLKPSDLLLFDELGNIKTSLTN